MSLLPFLIVDEPWGSSASTVMHDFDRDMQRFYDNMRRFQNDVNQTQRRQASGMNMQPFAREGVMTRDVVEEGGQKKLQMHFDVRNYRPEEIKVQVDGNMLKVCASHEEKTENGEIFRQFSRQFTVPDNVNPEALKSMLTPEGVLNIEAPYMALEAPKEPTAIPIDFVKK
ncbi:PREDICTED: heat shock protein Hsp-16.48/Hsp-16.49-like [Priapulus caudatus]|uniref:Heat shock protein Hsp-16.48/Hsp-16.49-like n=1 Tax=Priapulus caudatus TaxID=37621 RepID=A0ABM1E5Q9_PRICU|nr:PREDICTED: heat shock protein Hsp-16.48/Hsp-16.49-like [Priapulus caudatus]